MKTRVSIDNRRRLLLNAAALGTMVALAIPGDWVRPFVETVLPPAGAQSTTGCPALSIPGIVLSHDGPTRRDKKVYRVDDTASGCPVLITPTGKCRYNPETICIKDHGLISPHRVISITTKTYNYLNTSRWFVDTWLSLGRLPASVSEKFQSLSGATWAATYTVSGEGTRMIISDITLTPP